MRIRRLSAFLLLPALAAILAEPIRAQQSNEPVHDVAGTIAALMDAFNQGNADDVAAVWTDRAVHQENDAKSRLEGRKAIADRYRQFFSDHPGSQLAFYVTSAKEVAPTEIRIEGIADVSYSNGETTRSEVQATLKSQNGSWLFDNVQETQVAGPASAASNLGPLAWLVGKWSAKTEDATIDNTFQWDASQNFLVRNFQHHQQGKPDHSGVQYIGWDAEDQVIRSWHFDGSGSFAEGILQPDGENTWLGKIVFKLPDGRRGSLTQVFERTDEGKLIIQVVDQEVDGAAQPNSNPVEFTKTGT